MIPTRRRAQRPCPRLTRSLQPTHCTRALAPQAVCAEFLATFIFVFVVVSCVVFTNDTRFLPAVITLVRAPSATPSPPVLAAAAAAAAAASHALPHGLSAVPVPSALAPLPSPPLPTQPFTPPSLALPPTGRWLLSDSATLPWIQAATAPPPSSRRVLQSAPTAPNPSSTTTTTISISIESFAMNRWLFIALALGFMIGALVFSVGSISGANINPAVTLALAVSGKLSWFRALCYAVAQCAGSTLGALVVRSLAPSLFLQAGGGANGVVRNPAVSLWTVLGGEILGTGILVLTVCAAADVGREAKSKYQGALTPLMIGLAVAAAHLFLIPVDGCSLNPARSFGPAVATGVFSDHWLFWAGPCIGGILAATVYKNFFVGFSWGCCRDGLEEEGGGGRAPARLQGTGSAQPPPGVTYVYDEDAGGYTAAPAAGREHAGSVVSYGPPSITPGGGGGGGGGSNSVEETFSLDEDSLPGSSLPSGSNTQTPMFGAGGEGEAPAPLPSAQALALAVGGRGAKGVVRRLSTNPYPAGEGGAASPVRQGVREW